jgi:hypothetical protein
MDILETRKRYRVAEPLVATAAMALGVKLSKAAGVDPTMTMVTRPDDVSCKPLCNFPPGMAESANMFGDIHAPGQYFRAHPLASRLHERHRIGTRPTGSASSCLAHGTSPARTSLPTRLSPVPAGSFVRRVAKTPYYDGVKKGVAEPVIIAISGIGPITYHLTDPTKPGWREV